jgi:hypothetical protein
MAAGWTSKQGKKVNSSEGGGLKAGEGFSFKMPVTVDGQGLPI